MTLKDFKAAIDREGAHRYHFKALDPEFGTVKEEVNVALSCGASVTTQPWGPRSPHFPSNAIVDVSAKQNCLLSQLWVKLLLC